MVHSDGHVALVCDIGFTRFWMRYACAAACRARGYMQATFGTRKAPSAFIFSTAALPEVTLSCIVLIVLPPVICIPSTHIYSLSTMDEHPDEPTIPADQPMCMSCHSDSATYVCSPCEHLTLCRKCAMKQATVSADSLSTFINSYRLRSGVLRACKVLLDSFFGTVEVAICGQLSRSACRLLPLFLRALCREGNANHATNSFLASDALIRYVVPEGPSKGVHAHGASSYVWGVRGLMVPLSCMHACVCALFHRRGDLAVNRDTE